MGFRFFLIQNLKFKTAILAFIGQKEKKKDGFRKETKSLLFESAFIFNQKFMGGGYQLTTSFNCTSTCKNSNFLFGLELIYLYLDLVGYIKVFRLVKYFNLD